MKPFFITGLPRSRTAWLAALFSGPEARTICTHDLTAKVFKEGKGRGHLPQALRAQSEPPEGDWLVKSYSGLSDPGIALNHRLVQDLCAWYPESHWLVVQRNGEDVAASMLALLNGSGTQRNKLHLFHHLHETEKANHNLLSVVPRRNMMVVSYESLQYGEIIRAIHQHLCPFAPFPTDHYESIRDVRIVDNESEKKARDLWGFLL